MTGAIFNIPNEKGARIWQIWILISILLHGLTLGVLGFALPGNFMERADSGISIDLDMSAAASLPASVKPETSAEPEHAGQAQAEPVAKSAMEPDTEPRNKPEPMPEPKRAEAPKPKPDPKRSALRKPAPDEPIAAKERPGKKSGAATGAPSPQPAGKAASASLAAPAPVGGSSCPLPAYPELARKRGQEGTVNVRCQVDSSGHVTSVSLAKSSGFKLLDEAALKAVGKWKFRPASKDGASIAGVVVVPVQFKLH